MNIVNKIFPVLSNVEHQLKARWHPFGDKYFLVNRKPGTFEDNLKFCQQFNATLVTIESKIEDAFVSEIITVESWLGAEVTFVRDQRNVQWLDGSSMNYTNAIEGNCWGRES